MKKIILAIIVLATSVQCLWAQSFLPKNFSVDVTYMIPTGFQPKNVDGYSLELRGDELKMQLPYMGTATAPQFNSDGLNFTETVSRLTQQEEKNGAIEVKFSVRHDGDSYDVTITAFDNNRATIMVYPDAASACTYNGTWAEITENEQNNNTNH